MKTAGVEEEARHKERMGHTFSQQKSGTEDNATLVPGKYREV